MIIYHFVIPLLRRLSIVNTFIQDGFYGYHSWNWITRLPEPTPSRGGSCLLFPTSGLNIIQREKQKRAILKFPDPGKLCSLNIQKSTIEIVNCLSHARETIPKSKFSSALFLILWRTFSTFNVTYRWIYSYLYARASNVNATFFFIWLISWTEIQLNVDYLHFYVNKTRISG